MDRIFAWGTLFNHAQSTSKRIRVLLLDGQSGGPYHNWQLTTPILKKELDETGVFNVTVATARPSDGDFSNFKPNFRLYQVIVSNLDSPDWAPELRNSFEQYMRDGGGLVVVHAADNAFPNWTAYNEMTGIGGWRGFSEKAGPLWYMKDGKIISDPTLGNAGRHGARLAFQIVSRVPEHPFCKGYRQLGCTRRTNSTAHSAVQVKT